MYYIMSTVPTEFDQEVTTVNYGDSAPATSGGRRRRRGGTHRRRHHHHKHKHRRTHRRTGTRRRRGGSVLGQLAVPFSLIALQQFVARKSTQKQLRGIDKTLGRPGTTVMKGVLRTLPERGVGIIRTVTGTRKKRRKR
jgi:hypothetical protein